MTRFISIRRWFRFSLLGLLVTVTIAAGAAGWIAYHLNWIRQREAVLARDDLAIPIVSFVTTSPPWPLGWFGTTLTGIPEFYLPEATSDEELERVRRLFPEKYVTRLGGEPPWEP